MLTQKKILFTVLIPLHLLGANSGSYNSTYSGAESFSNGQTSAAVLALEQVQFPAHPAAAAAAAAAVHHHHYQPIVIGSPHAYEPYAAGSVTPATHAAMPFNTESTQMGQMLFGFAYSVKSQQDHLMRCINENKKEIDALRTKYNAFHNEKKEHAAKIEASISDIEKMKNDLLEIRGAQTSTAASVALLDQRISRLERQKAQKQAARPSATAAAASAAAYAAQEGPSYSATAAASAADQAREGFPYSAAAAAAKAVDSTAQESVPSFAPTARGSRSKRIKPKQKKTAPPKSATTTYVLPTGPITPTS
jgi:hypothetical protein